MKFEIGKYYKHTGGGMMHVVSAAKTTMYGWCLIAEEHGGSNLIPIGSDEVSALNWTEATKEEWLAGFSK
jgi:hypothetical protein